MVEAVAPRPKQAEEAAPLPAYRISNSCHADLVSTFGHTDTRSPYRRDQGVIAARSEMLWIHSSVIQITPQSALSLRRRWRHQPDTTPRHEATNGIPITASTPLPRTENTAIQAADTACVARGADRADGSTTMTEVETVQDEQSPYARVGGGAAVRVVVDRFYELVIGDPTLAPYFVDSDLTNLKRHQVQLISHLLGGPVTYAGRELRDAHAGLAITPEAYGRVVEHLVGVLVDAGVPDDIIASLGGTLEAVQPDIVSQQS